MYVNLCSFRLRNPHTVIFFISTLHIYSLSVNFDTRSPFDPSGLRIGTAGETTRGKKEVDMVKLAKRINNILRK